MLKNDSLTDTVLVTLKVIMSIGDYLAEQIAFCKVSEFINILTQQKLIESTFIMIGIRE